MAGEQTTPPGVTTTTQPQFVGSATGQPITTPAAEGTPPAAGAGDPPDEAPAADDGAGTSTETSEGEAPVVGHGGREMSGEAISARVERANKKQLREIFGTDDPDQIKAIVAKGKESGTVRTPAEQEEFDRLKRQESARTRARLTQQQRSDADIKTKDARILELEGQITRRDQDVAVSEQDSVINEAAQGHIEPGLMRHVRRDLAAHLTELQTSNPAAFAKFGPRQLGRYFERYAVDNPSFAVKAAQEEGSAPAPATPSKPAPVKRQVTTTKTHARPPAPSAPDGPGSFNGKVVKPGQPNSMNKQELREYAKTQGHKLNY